MLPLHQAPIAKELLYLVSVQFCHAGYSAHQNVIVLVSIHLLENLPVALRVCCCHGWELAAGPLSRALDACPWDLHTRECQVCA